MTSPCSSSASPRAAGPSARAAGAEALALETSTRMVNNGERSVELRRFARGVIRFPLDTPQQVDSPLAQAIDGGIHDIADPSEDRLPCRGVEPPDGMKPVIGLKR